MRVARSAPAPLLAVVVTVSLVSGCSGSQQPNPPEPVQAFDAHLRCADALAKGGTHHPDDLRLGPLAYTGARALADLTPREYLGENPTKDDTGAYFYKVGAIVRAGQAVTVTITRPWRVLLKGPSRVVPGGAQSIRYAACPDRDTVWVGGFLVRGAASACVDLDFQVVGHVEVHSTVLSLFRGCSRDRRAG